MSKRIRIRIQKKRTARRDEPQTDVEVPREVNSRTKKILADSAALIREIEVLLKESAVKTKEVARLIQPIRHLPRVPNCEGRMIDLLRRQ